MGDRDRLQHLTACPGESLKVIEREKDTYGGMWKQDREKETCNVAGGWYKGKKGSQTSSVRKIGTNAAYSERHKWSPDGRTHAQTRIVHTYTEEKDMHPSSSLSRLSPPLARCDALHLQQGFPLGYTPLQAVFLTLLSLFFILSWPAWFFSSTLPWTQSLHGINAINIGLVI